MTAFAEKIAPDLPSSAPDFECGGVIFRCGIAGDGQRYVWRSACGRMEVSAAGVRFPTDAERAVGAHAKRLWRAVLDGRELSAECVSIRAGMDLAVWTMRRGG